MDILKQYDGIIGKKYISQQKQFFSSRKDRATNAMQKLLPNIKGKIVLDIGCGSGRDIILYESLGAKECWGIDTSKYMIKEAKKNITHPERAILSNIEKTSFKNKQFDVVAARFSMHYLKNFEKAYKEISRILKPKGVLVMAVDHPIRELASKKKAYKVQEIIHIGLYHGKVDLKFPTHTVDEYFSPTFFKYFYLDGFLEDRDYESSNPKKTADFMTIKAIRR
jgi:ubiquinone/menaquinone biosynthesis C-methylase UbiE